MAKAKTSAKSRKQVTEEQQDEPTTTGQPPRMLAPGQDESQRTGPTPREVPEVEQQDITATGQPAWPEPRAGIGANAPGPGYVS